MNEMFFVGFLGIITALIVTTVARYLGGRAAFLALTGLLVWLSYAGLLGYAGVFKNMTMRPPGIVFLVVPVLVFLPVFLAFVVLSSASARVALAIPLWILLGAQSFRVGVELFLQQLWIDGLVPKMLTFDGANVDIYVGASAVLIAWLSARGTLGLRLALAWNVLGLLALANVVTRAVLTAPGPLHLIHAEVPIFCWAHSHSCLSQVCLFLSAWSCTCLPCALSSAGCARRQHRFKLIRSHIELKKNEDCNTVGARF